MQASIVIPAYNEAKRLPRTLERVQAYLSQQTYDAEIVVVDDGSRDGTADLVRRDWPRVRLASYKPNRGKGFAVKMGMTTASGEYRIFYDADGATPIEELERVWPRFQDGADIVIGSRSVPDARVLVHQAWYRELIGRGFNRLLRILRLTPFIDTQCGFKAFTARAARIVFAKQLLHRFTFDAEVLLIATRHGLRIVEVPVEWTNSKSSRVNLLTTAPRTLRDIVQIRRNLARGLYDPDGAPERDEGDEP